MYFELNEMVNPKVSRFHGSIAYFVNIIPKKATRFDNPFTPPDKATGGRCPENENIRIIDGASFYHLVTGKENALRELQSILPKVVENVLAKLREKEIERRKSQLRQTDDIGEPKVFGKKDYQLFSKIFDDAFGQLNPL